jgi:hypothetical protein
VPSGFLPFSFLGFVNSKNPKRPGTQKLEAFSNLNGNFTKGADAKTLETHQN